MTHPGFLVIGAQRAGTTWLDHHLRAHPAVYLPVRRKELHYFDWHYERGARWYRSFFPSATEAGRYRAIGEITPRYLFDPAVPERIRRDLPDCRLIAILRNPVDRAYSQYALAVRDLGERASFDEFLERNPDAIERGQYARQLARYFDRFPRERILVLEFASVMRNSQAALRRVADFLDIDPDAFDEISCQRKVNASYRPRHARLRSGIHRVGRLLRDLNLDWCVNVAKEIGIPNMFGNEGPLPPLSEATRCELARRFEADVDALERMLAIDFSKWRESCPEADGTAPRETGRDA